MESAGDVSIRLVSLETNNRGGRYSDPWYPKALYLWVEVESESFGENSYNSFSRGEAEKWKWLANGDASGRTEAGNTH